MSEQALVARIISDAEQEAAEIINDAEQKAAETVARAEERAERNKIGTQAEIKERAKGISDGKAAAARLDCAKILLGEKRGVIDEVYSRALQQLNEMNKTDSLYLAEKLLSAYAEEGDEIVFDESFRYAAETSALPVVKEKKLKVSPKPAKLGGGFMLCGKNSDKDVSYAALLAADREMYQAEIAAEIFTD